MSGMGITLALGLVIVAVTIWMIRQHTEASRNVPIVAGPLGAFIAAASGLAALYLFLAPFASRPKLLFGEADLDDPIGRGRDFYRRVYAQIEADVRKLVEERA